MKLYLSGTRCIQSLCHEAVPQWHKMHLIAVRAHHVVWL